MKIALTHYYNINKEYYYLEIKRTSLEEVVQVIAKLLIIESDIDERSVLPTKELAKLLVTYFNFTSDLREYHHKNILKKGKIEVVDFKKIQEFQNQKIIYEIDTYELWEIYLCTRSNNDISNYEVLKEEINEDKDDLTGKLHKAIYKAIRINSKQFYDYSIKNLNKKYEEIRGGEPGR